ncbi:hypothetical protein K435DRAFT_800143 [Dendrothele bispora CBS 962.96]|uniref:Uncharacterized protein n=1 Tax=Dendrothele bispora (strain CBS 962.96) TaxID=1314807 RepID=A0A4S8LTK1_DENBC|nr:hypothetical protein K435DRAFT_800143 [Dendrothele bispora CBS 962.96]
MAALVDFELDGPWRLLLFAILRWQTENGAPEPGRPRLKRTAKYLLLWSFRRLQRARDEKSWENELQIFIKCLKHIVPASSFSTVLNYFKTNWFSETWRDLWTDIGLPRGHNRDRISTINFTERAFKKFDEIFLENWANKSCPSHPKKKDEVYYQTALQGHRLWNSGRAIIDGSVDKEGHRLFQVLSEI